MKTPSQTNASYGAQTLEAALEQHEQIVQKLLGKLGMEPLETERENSNVGAGSNPVTSEHKGFDSSGHLWQSAALLDIRLKRPA